MNFNQYECGGGKAVPVNPHNIPDERDFYLRKEDGVSWGDFYYKCYSDFESWLQSQPTLHTNAPDGVYPVGEFGEPKWRYRNRDRIDWRNCGGEPPSPKNSMNEYQLFIEHTGAKQPVSGGIAFPDTPSDDYLKSLPFNEKYFSNEAWHPDESDITDMGKDWYDEAISEWQLLENSVLFDGFRVHFESCDCGDGYGCSHGSYPYDLVHPFADTEMCWEDEGFYIESPSGLIRFDRTSEMTMYHFVKACELLDLKLTYNHNYTQQ